MSQNDDRRGFDRLDDTHNDNNSTIPYLQNSTTAMSRPVVENDYTTASTYWQQSQFSTEKSLDAKKMEHEDTNSSTSDVTTYYDQNAALNPPITNTTKEKSNDNRKSSGVGNLLSTLSFPIINILATCIIVGILIYVYQYANGKSTDTTMGGMKIPTVVSLLMTFVKMLVASGIASAVAEYKWIRLQDKDGQPLALIDVYDACTRGIGGIVRILKWIKLDLILIPAILFQIGLVAMGPASQQILTTADLAICDRNNAGVWYTNLSSTDMTTLSSTNGVSSMKGLKQDYLVRYALQQASLGFQVQPYYNCPLDSINCTFTGIQGFHSTVTCNPGSLNTTTIVDLKTDDVTTLSHYFGYDRANSIFSPFLSVPAIFYDGSMKGRTYYDFNNYTKSFGSSIKNNRTYDAEMRKMFGDQKFVLVLTDDGGLDGYMASEKIPQVLECMLHSAVNTSTLLIQSVTKRHQLMSQIPIEFDYDLLSNSTYWSTHYIGSNFTMLNAYGLQFSIMKNLIVANGMSQQDMDSYNGYSNGFQEIVENWKMLGYSPTNLNSSTVDSFFFDMMQNIDFSAVYGIPDSMFGMKGTHCFYTGNFYQLNPAAFYSLSFSLLIPLGWWAFLWIVSLYKSSWISRGNSQVALLVAGISPTIREHFKGLSHANQRSLLKQAANTKVVLGEEKIPTETGGRHLQPTNHLTFGAPSEINYIQTRRRSF
ncbi:hypothetical protein INT45_007569 [Circinella minor]|uniref:Uncharacterized protein n=1 Tax=Circinella minor TaxID=1195481 RepID=A0A8H7S616_9FUNG|nr:hypothetical protein INT45_007569 [Circinella minor]